MKRTPLKRKTPLRRYTTLQSRTPLKRLTPLNKRSAKGKALVAQERKLKAELIDDLPLDSHGNMLCPHCMKRPDFRGFCLIHKKRRSQGGKLDSNTCWIGCWSCHNGEDKTIGGHDLREQVANPMWSKCSQSYVH